MTSAMQAQPFTIAIDDTAIDDLRARLDRWRQAADFANDDWSYGVNGDYLRELMDYWRDDYDWRAQEAKMNAYPHYRVDIDGIPIHFMHIRGRGDNPTPLIMTHGWPWTFWDFADMIEPLIDPESHGGNADDAFDLVIPSLPGFGFSSPLSTTGVGFARTAELWDKLMREVLGYSRYAAHGGDWGSLVTAALGHYAHEHIIAVHESMGGFLGVDYYGLAPEDYDDSEKDWPKKVAAKMPVITSHMAVHTSDPQTLAFALDDSPAGLAAWILERRRAWSDCNGDVEQCYSKDDLLNTISIYWFTRTIGTSMRFYKECMVHSPWQPVHDVQPVVPVPSGFAIFPEDNILVPRKAAERYANVQHWNVMPRGGHFSAAEQPQLLVADIRQFFRSLNQ